MKTVQVVLIAALIGILALNLVVIGLVVGFDMTFLCLEFYDEVFQKTQFYGQVRQWIFNRVNAELPNGHEALPHLEKAMTEDWLRDEVLVLGGHLFKFLKGQSDQLPVIPIYKLFDRLSDYMNEVQRQNKDKIISYWFGPIPERVRFQDILSVEFFWVVRQIIRAFKWLSWGAIAVFFALAGILVMIAKGIKQSLIWIGTSMAAAGGVMLELSLGVQWILLTNDTMLQWASSFASLKFPVHAIESVMRAFVEHFLFRFNIIAGLVLVVGVTLIAFCHFDRRLTVIK
ncbi:hypothetical protein JOD02_000446 [Caldicoprobacter guelmensis]|uniref:hypothetical protein n=1 Tax=Caldicoprobacter guelmensis TaxID=1170224 RepID=UPI001957EBC4|nr:hypothetical protein [Caldicoprobacter guelmensis]MBM7581623.1 hypothetical protein [Caldicoprobacter guelmensis]